MFFFFSFVDVMLSCCFLAKLVHVVPVSWIPLSRHIRCSFRFPSLPFEQMLTSRFGRHKHIQSQHFLMESPVKTLEKSSTPCPFFSFALCFLFPVPLIFSCCFPLAIMSVSFHVFVTALIYLFVFLAFVCFPFSHLSGEGLILSPLLFPVRLFPARVGSVFEGFRFLPVPIPQGFGSVLIVSVPIRLPEASGLLHQAPPDLTWNSVEPGRWYSVRNSQ